MVSQSSAFLLAALFVSAYGMPTAGDLTMVSAPAYLGGGNADVTAQIKPAQQGPAAGVKDESYMAPGDHLAGKSTQHGYGDGEDAIVRGRPRGRRGSVDDDNWYGRRRLGKEWPASRRDRSVSSSCSSSSASSCSSDESDSDDCECHTASDNDDDDDCSDGDIEYRRRRSWRLRARPGRRYLVIRRIRSPPTRWTSYRVRGWYRRPRYHHPVGYPPMGPWFHRVPGMASKWDDPDCDTYGPPPQSAYHPILPPPRRLYRRHVDSPSVEHVTGLPRIYGGLSPAAQTGNAAGREPRRPARPNQRARDDNYNDPRAGNWNDFLDRDYNSRTPSRVNDDAYGPSRQPGVNGRGRFDLARHHYRNDAFDDYAANSNDYERGYDDRYLGSFRLRDRQTDERSVRARQNERLMTDRYGRVAGTRRNQLDERQRSADERQFSSRGPNGAMDYSRRRGAEDTYQADDRERLFHGPNRRAYERSNNVSTTSRRSTSESFNGQSRPPPPNYYHNYYY